MSGFNFNYDPNNKQTLKKLNIPKGFELIIDTREQKPLPLPNYCPTVSKCIHDGDYSITGYEDHFAIERKQMSDFTTYISIEHEKTSAKKARFTEILKRGGFVALIIDGANYDDILKGYQYGGLTPMHYETFISRWQIKYGFHFMAHRDSKVLARWVMRQAVEFYSQAEAFKKQNGVSL